MSDEVAALADSMGGARVSPLAEKKAEEPQMTAAEKIAAAKKAKNKKKNKAKKKKGKKKPSQGFTDHKMVGGGAKAQTSPVPSIPVRCLYSNGLYPVGELHEYTDHNSYRTTDEELRAKDRLNDSQLNDLRFAAEVHRQVRAESREYIKPGIKLKDMCARLESSLDRLIEKNGLIRRQAFPTGCSLNHIAAHFTPNKDDEDIFTEHDIMKMDFGTSVHGHIIDCAWTVTFDPELEAVKQAAIEATNEGLKHAGIDARLGEIGAAIQEVMESHEATIKGKTYQVRSIENLCGHSIAPYIIHAGKSVPIVRGGAMTKMEEGEVYAIETFATTGRAHVQEAGATSHYMIDPSVSESRVRDKAARELLQVIKTNFGTLAFCRRWLDNLGLERYMLSLRALVRFGVVNEYPPLVEEKGAYTAQMEHTLILRPTYKEIISRGDDF